MKSKLKITINSELVKRSNLYAMKNEISLSQLVEELLEKTLAKDKVNFSEKWLGNFNIDNKKDNRTEYLKNRYRI